MNPQEIYQFLNFIEGLIPSKDNAIYYSREKNGNDYFYFYTKSSCAIYVHSLGNNVNFLFSSMVPGEKSRKEMSVNISFNEAKPILEILFKAHQSRKLDDFLHQEKMSFKDIEKDLNFINSYLSVTNLDDKFKYQEDGLILYLKSPDKKEYEVKIGRLYQNVPEKKNIMHVCEIPVVLKGQGSQGEIYIEHVIPGWEIANYESLKKVLPIDNGINSLEDFSNKLKNVSPSLGTIFLTNTLENELPLKVSKGKSLKL